MVESDFDDSLKGFYSYSGFSEPEFLGENLDDFMENVSFREGYLTDSIDVTNETLSMFNEELDWIKEYYGEEIDLDSADHVEHLNSFLYEYGVWVNPTKEDLQEFNKSKLLDDNQYIEGLFSETNTLTRKTNKDLDLGI